MGSEEELDISPEDLERGLALTVQTHRVLEVYREALAALEDPQMAERRHTTEGDVEVGKRGVWLRIFLLGMSDQRHGLTQSYTVASPDASSRTGRHGRHWQHRPTLFARRAKVQQRG